MFIVAFSFNNSPKLKITQMNDLNKLHYNPHRGYHPEIKKKDR